MTHRRWQTVSWRAKTISLTCRRSLWAAVFCLAACYVMSGSAYASAADASDLSGHPAMTLPPPPPPEYDTPELLWSYSTGNTIESTPVVVDGILYVGSVDHHLYALDAASGELLWRYQLGAVGISVPTVADGVVYVGTVEGDLYALKVPQPSAEQSSTQQPEQERKVETTSPEILWQFETVGLVTSFLTEVDGVLYFGSAKADGLDLNKGLLYALDASGGELLWRYDIGRFRIVPAIVSNGIVYVVSLEDKVVAFRLPQ